MKENKKLDELEATEMNESGEAIEGVQKFRYIY